MYFTQKNTPNFFIVGAPKAGTTFLYHALKQHPDIFLSELKEPNYFSIEEIDRQGLFVETENIRTKEAYAALFEGVTTEKVIGEASVSYLFYESAPRSIFSFNPEATIVILLRDPVKRAYSHYLMDYNFGYINVDFDEVLSGNLDHKYADLYYQQYVELGFYDEQIERYLNLFGDRVNIYLTGELKNNRSGVLKDLFKTLNVEEHDLSVNPNNANSYMKARFPLVRNLYGNHKVKQAVKSITGSRFNAKIKNFLFDKDVPKPKMSEDSRTYLQELYKLHIKRTQELLGRDLTHWLHT